MHKSLKVCDSLAHLSVFNAEFFNSLVLASSLTFETLNETCLVVLNRLDFQLYQRQFAMQRLVLSE